MRQGKPPCQPRHVGLSLPPGYLMKTVARNENETWGDERLSALANVTRLKSALISRGMEHGIELDTVQPQISVPENTHPCLIVEIK